jgi:hypothetical protein
MLSGNKTFVVGCKRIGFAAVQIAGDCRLYQGLTVKADPSNSRPIWVSPHATVRAAPHILAGFCLYPGESHTFGTDSPEWYAVSDDLDQVLTLVFA